MLQKHLQLKDSHQYFFFFLDNGFPLVCQRCCYHDTTKVTISGLYLELLGNPSDTIVQDVVVGDIVLLEPGEVIPCNGVFLSGHN